MAKHDLVIEPPLMNAAGSLGFSPDIHAGIDWTKLGAFITHPVSMEGRTPANGRRYLSFAGGFVLHTGYPNPGMRQVLRRYARQWKHSPVPVIVHLLGRSADEVARMARPLEGMEGVIGLEVGVNSEASAERVTALIQAAVGELAVIACLPVERAIDLARYAIDAGAAAISLAAPRGTFPAGNGELMQGRIYGPAVLPLALKAVQDLTRMGIPTLGAGGVYTLEHKDAMLAAGALAVQLDSVLWRGVGYSLFT